MKLPTSSTLAKKLLILLTALGLSLFAFADKPSFQSGKVTRVYDGDSFQLIDSTGKRREIRLFGIDAPEGRQAGGRNAQHALHALIHRRWIQFKVVDTDTYDRWVVSATIDGVSINQLQVQTGNAWWYRRYAPRHSTLRNAEKYAREQRLGLWKDSNPLPPWRWRKLNKK